MKKLIDPVSLLVEKAAAAEKQKEEAVASGNVPYEIPFEPRPGAKLARLTVASTYRTPIPVFYDKENRTTFPIPVE